MIRNQIHYVVSGLCFDKPIEVNLFGSSPTILYIDHIEVPRKDGFIDGSTLSPSSPGGFMFRPNESRDTDVAYKHPFGDGTYSTNIDTLSIQKKLQIVIPIQLHIKSMSMIENNEKAIAGYLTIVNLHIDVYGEMIRFRKDSSGNTIGIWPWGHSLNFRLDKIAFNLLDDLVSPEQKQELRASLSDVASVGI